MTDPMTPEAVRIPIRIPDLDGGYLTGKDVNERLPEGRHLVYRKPRAPWSDDKPCKRGHLAWVREKRSRYCRECRIEARLGIGGER